MGWTDRIARCSKAKSGYVKSEEKINTNRSKYGKHVKWWSLVILVMTDYLRQNKRDQIWCTKISMLFCTWTNGISLVYGMSLTTIFAITQCIHCIFEFSRRSFCLKLSVFGNNFIQNICSWAESIFFLKKNGNKNIIFGKKNVPRFQRRKSCSQSKKLPV